MKSAHAMLELLEKRRRETHDRIGNRPMGVAACQVLDELIRRVRVVTDRAPADAKITISDIQRLPDIVKMMTTLNRMGELLGEGGEAVEPRRQDLLGFVDRIKSEGYDVANDFAITDTTDWTALNDTTDPATQVQLAAEQIARTEHAAIHQAEIERLVAEMTDVEDGYAERIRGLVVEDDA